MDSTILIRCNIKLYWNILFLCLRQDCFQVRVKVPTTKDTLRIAWRHPVKCSITSPGMRRHWHAIVFVCVCPFRKIQCSGTMRTKDLKVERNQSNPCWYGIGRSKAGELVYADELSCMVSCFTLLRSYINDMQFGGLFKQQSFPSLSFLTCWYF